MSIEVTVLATGPLALLEDSGRPGLAHLGITRSGAADRAAYRLGARLVGSTEHAAAIECVLGGLRVTFSGATTVAITGAPAPTTRNGAVVGHQAPVHVAAGDTIEVGMPPTGLRTYLSVRGGLIADPRLPSQSTDTLSGLGPARLMAGQVLLIGSAVAGLPHVDHVPHADPSGPKVLEAVRGPRDAWLIDPVDLTTPLWTVSPTSNRVGTRLSGPGVRARAGQLPSEGCVRGAIQVPPGGEPVIFGADHPATGGYPVVAVLTEASADLAAQLRPGDSVRVTLRD